MITFKNVHLHNSINTLSIKDYFNFTMYYRLFEASAPLLMQGYTEFANDTILRIKTLLELKDEQEQKVFDIIQRIENSKVSLFQTAMGTNYIFFAIACLISKVDNKKVENNTFDKDGLFELSSKIKDVSIFEIIEQIRHISDILQDELLLNFPDVFRDIKEQQIQDFEYIKTKIMSIDLDQDIDADFANQILWDIHKYFLHKTSTIDCNPNSSTSYEIEYKQLITNHYDTLGFTEIDIEKISTYAFYAKHRLHQKQVKEMKQKIKESEL